MKEVKVKTNAGNIGFWISFIACWAWALFGNVSNSGFINISMYDYLVKDASTFELANTINLSQTVTTIIAISILALFISSFVGLIFHIAAGKKTVVLEENEPKNTNTKVCPDCAESIKAAAKVCRFCGKRFDSEEIDDLPSMHT